MDLVNLAHRIRHSARVLCALDLRQRGLSLQTAERGARVADDVADHAADERAGEHGREAERRRDRPARAEGVSGVAPNIAPMTTPAVTQPMKIAFARRYALSAKRSITRGSKSGRSVAATKDKIGRQTDFLEPERVDADQGPLFICIMPAALSGSVSPGTVDGATATQMPKAMNASAKTRDRCNP